MLSSNVDHKLRFGHGDGYIKGIAVTTKGSGYHNNTTDITR